MAYNSVERVSVGDPQPDGSQLQNWKEVIVGLEESSALVDPKDPSKGHYWHIGINSGLQGYQTVMVPNAIIPNEVKANPTGYKLCTHLKMSAAKVGMLEGYTFEKREA